ncbi:FHA domain-containing protein [Roseicyclus amphidinii]|uniref:FHA domain-containing protein n=1 Tax=Roseicyclus amphidinii TaxID=3034232 RepID=UPI0024E0E469|nr:FHA domain-containing protein [Roseicyclus sp. Amp-Y-6]
MSDTTPSTSSPRSDAAPPTSGSGTVTLKVLTGSQVGVEVNLPDGQFTFGSDEAADVRFLDVTMAPLHGQIRIGGGKIQLQATGGAIITGSGLAIEPGGDSWHEIAQLDRVRAGTTQFALGDRAARWADVLDPADTSGSTAPRRATRSDGGPGRGLMVPALGVLALLAVAGLVWQGSGAAGPTVAGAESASTEAALQAAIDGFPFGPVLSLEIEADGRSIVSGYVETAAERRAVEAAVAEIDPNARRRIWVREAMRTDIDGMIDSQGLEVTSTVAPDGVVRLEGRVLDPARAETLVSMIGNEVFGVASIDNRIETAEHILAAVDTLLGQAGLGDVVIARLDGLLIETTGVIPNARAERWIGFVQTYANRYADILPLRSFVTLESAPAGAAAEPLVVGGAGELDGLGGRRIPTERLGPDQDLRLDEVFGSLPSEGESPGAGEAPDTATAATAAGAAAGAGGGTDGGAGGGTDGGNTRTPSSPVATAMVLDFAARNPDLVDTIIREVTGGRFDGLDELRAVPAPGTVPASAEGPGLPPLPAGGRIGPAPAQAAVAAGFVSPTATGAEATGPEATGPEATGPEATGAEATGADGDAVLAGSVQSAVAPVGRLDPLTDSADSSTLRQAQADGAPPVPGAAPRIPDAALPEVGSAPAMTEGFTRFPTLRSADLGILGATAALLRQDSAADQSVPAGPEAAPSLARVAPDLLRLVREQQSALELGGSLLPPPPPRPAPLAALPTDPGGAGRAGCWRGAHFDSADIPAALLWLDMLSLGETGELGQLGLDTQLQVFDAALSPVRLLRCMGADDVDYTQQLIEASAFLNEIWRNESFLDYVFRDVPRAELDISGIDLSGERRIALGDLRVLREGGAPDAASRVVVIGELGALLRVRDGYRLALYPADLDWRVEE